MNNMQALSEALPQNGQAVTASGSGSMVHPSATETDTQKRKGGKCTAAITKYHLKWEPSFANLSDIREQGWNDKDADKFFADKQKRAGNLTDQQKMRFFEACQWAAEELNSALGCMDIRKYRIRREGTIVESPAVLDLGMAPGGFSAIAMKINLDAVIRAITLDPSPAHGGNAVMLNHDLNCDIDLKIQYLDITMLAGEMGMKTGEVEFGHPLAKKLNYDRLGRIFPGIEVYDLVSCGAVPTNLKNQPKSPYRELVQGLLLSLSQLVIAVRHIRKGGTIVMLMYRPETWITTQLLYMVSKFARVQTFKPRSHQRATSSFYLIAEDVDSLSTAAKDALVRWTTAWCRLTIDTDRLHDFTIAELEDTDLCGHTVEEVLDTFGPRLADLSRTVWLEQAEGLENPPWKRTKE